MPSKIYHTRQTLARLPNPHGYTLGQALREWWSDVWRESGGLKLSNSGASIFQDLARLPVYVFEMEREHISPNLLLTLSRKVDCPWFIGARTRWPLLMLFGEQEAMMCTLCGTVDAWAKYLQHQPNRVHDQDSLI